MKKLFIVLVFIIPCEINNSLLKFSFLKVISTAYSPSKKECDNTPFITATGKKVFEGGIAVSKKLEAILPLDSQVWINGRSYEINDRMSKRWKDLRIDIFCFNRKNALKYGKKEVIIKYISK